VIVALAQSNQNGTKRFDTSGSYAWIGGFLILPALATVVMFISSVLIVMISNPSTLGGLNLIMYVLSVLLIPYIIFIFYNWVKRKLLLPLLMVIFFSIQAAISIGYMVLGLENEFINVFLNLIWAIYFIRSIRVKETFTE